MFIPSVCCITGSFFHTDGRNAGAKIANHSCLIFSLISVDNATGVAVAIIALLAFSSFAPHALSSLPLSMKVTMLVGGTLLLAIDPIYLFYRLKKIESEGESQEQETEPSEAIKHLEHAEQQKLEVLEELNGAIKMLQIRVLEGEKAQLMIKALQIQHDLQNELKHTREDLEYYSRLNLK